MRKDDAKHLARAHNRAEWPARGLRLTLAAYVSIALFAIAAVVIFIVMALG